MTESILLFRVKICGLKTPLDAAAAVSAGADAIGLNFYAPSSRYVDEKQAATLVAALPPGVCKVGLFVNSSLEQILTLQSRLGLDLIQLHGDETPEFVGQLGETPVLKAFRLAPGEVDKVVEFVSACQAAAAPLAGVLIDAYDASQFGGTGQKADWHGAAELRAKLGDLPLILAGGLTPNNVAEAIAAVKPYGVDTASGVEVTRGQKDGSLSAAFVRAARAALGI